MFIGVKMVTDPWWHISVGSSLAVVAGILLLAALLSLLAGPGKESGGMPA
jgi:hypothetical protein